MTQFKLIFLWTLLLLAMCRAQQKSIVQVTSTQKPIQQQQPTTAAVGTTNKQNQPQPQSLQKSAAQVASTQSQQQNQQDAKCLQPMEPGPCRMNLERFYYNSKTNSCEKFKFGGCRGNDNKFGFLKTCEDACKITNSAAAPQPAPQAAQQSNVQPKIQPNAQPFAQPIAQKPAVQAAKAKKELLNTK